MTFKNYKKQNKIILDIIIKSYPEIYEKAKNKIDHMSIPEKITVLETMIKIDEMFSAERWKNV